MYVILSHCAIKSNMVKIVYKAHRYAIPDKSKSTYTEQQGIAITGKSLGGV